MKRNHILMGLAFLAVGTFATVGYSSGMFCSGVCPAKGEASAQATEFAMEGDMEAMPVAATTSAKKKNCAAWCKKMGLNAAWTASYGAKKKCDPAACKKFKTASMTAEGYTKKNCNPAACKYKKRMQAQKESEAGQDVQLAQVSN